MIYEISQKKIEGKQIIDKKTQHIIEILQKIEEKNLIFQRIQNKHEIPFHRSNDMMHIKLDKQFFGYKT